MRESSHSPLPQVIDALRLADAGAKLKGFCDLDAMARLDLDRTRPAGELMADLAFFRDAQGRRLAGGGFSASLPRICQRCLGPMIEDVAGSVSWALARDEQEAATLDASFEAVILANAPLKLWDALEDELILAQLLAPMHENPADCGPRLMGSLNEMKPQGDEPQGDEVLANPFSVLRELKRR